MCPRCVGNGRKRLTAVCAILAMALVAPVALLSDDKAPPAPQADAPTPADEKFAPARRSEPASDLLKPLNILGGAQPAAKDEPGKATAKEKQPAPLPPLVPRPGLIIRGGVRIQFGANGLVAQGEPTPAYALFPSDRELSRQLEKAKSLVEQEQYADAYHLLDDILKQPRDYFDQADRGQPTHRSLKAQARELIAGLPEEALKHYDLQFGATARHLLDAATATGDITAIAAVARRYFNTEAGFEATWLIGKSQLDHGQPLAAAIAFQTLYDTPRARQKFGPALSVALASCWARAGLPSRAETVLRGLREGGTPPRIAARDVPLFHDDAKALQWLAANFGSAPSVDPATVSNWTMNRGNPARNAAATGGPPLLTAPRWQQSLVAHTPDEPASRAVNEHFVDTSEVDLPAETPLLIGDVGVVRTPRWVLGVDLRTGKRIWEYPTSENENYAPRQQVINPNTNVVMQIRPDRLATRQTISSDGERVFLVEDRGNQPYVFPGAFVPWGRTPNVMAPSASNTLLARDLSTQGKLAWEAGGETGEDEPALAEVYFLGAPLVLRDELFVIGQAKGEISLYVLDAKTGKLAWTQPLVTVEMPVSLDSYRRLHGASPSFADGVLVCPTAAGAVVAVDLASRSLLWGYQYPRNQMTDAYGRRRHSEVANPFTKSCWADSTALIDGGRVLITPADSDQLHCLNLVDGQPVWKPVARGDSRYLACVHHDVALLVGRSEVRGLKLSDGQPAWEPQKLAAGSPAVPSGRGFYCNGEYFLPLSNAEIVTVSVADGVISSRVKLRGGHVPGNLVAHQGNVVSLNQASLDCYFQVEERRQWAERMLVDRPDDPQALAVLGEVSIDRGKLSEGLGHLRRSFELEPNERVRDHLIAAHLEALARDFANHRDQAAVIEPLLIEPAERSNFARQMALGLQRSGEAAAAFGYFVKMCQPGGESLGLETAIPGELLVRRDRWVRGKIAELRAEASAEELKIMDEHIERHFDELGGFENGSVMRQFFSYFGDQATVARLRDRYVQDLVNDGNLREAEPYLLDIAESKDRSRAADAYVQLATLLVSAGRREDAAACYRVLRRSFGSEEVGGTSVEELVDRAASDPELAAHFAATSPWPGEVVKAEVIPRNLESTGVQLELTRAGGPFLDEVTLEIDPGRQEFMARDGLGRPKFRVPLTAARRNNRTTYGSGIWARAYGRLLVVQVGSLVFAVDAIEAEKDGRGRIVWQHDLGDGAGNGPEMRMQVHGANNRRARPQLFENGQAAGGIWPVGSRQLCLQRGKKLLAIDVTTGEILWTRLNMPVASEIFGDDEYTFVMPLSGREAVVLRTLDGQKQEARKVADNSRLTTLGRTVVSYTTLNSKPRLRVFDAWTDEELWSREFSPKSKVELIEADEIAVMEPQGRFVVYSLADKRVVIDREVPAEPELSGLQVFRLEDRYVVVACRPLQRRGTMNLHPLSTYLRSSQVIQGRTFALDRRTGEELWTGKIGPTAIVHNQPSRLPLLVFAVITNEPQPGGGPNHSATIVHCLDTRNGRILAEHRLDRASGSLAVIGNLEEHTLEVRTPERSLVLSFGEKPDGERDTE